ncbi:dynein regulatory complex subunit 7 isoform X2 [Callorhinchus milii]|nr:dynein regulatory complex subunit 7 isoform X2 [Callorhinchus milii]|eukprot:gi/632977250/ref/XP_007905243.1/ PREDICTED: coiled-coil domain-containing protein lobo homolog isoform X2 [Callorhinchus milii]
MEPLIPYVDVPQFLYSPTTFLRRQKGNCFDFSIMLCSLLIGTGHDAYCVSGYAIKEICMMDESKEICPLLQEKPEVKQKIIKPPSKKYAVKPPRDLRSRFELGQEAKKVADMKAEEEKKKRELAEKLAEEERKSREMLHGLRIHSWVLVLAGKREVPENFFIDPFTGNSYKTTNDRFLGIESVWNHKNYWVNMQDCRNGCKDLTFDLGDPVKWEYVLIDPDMTTLNIPDSDEFLVQDEDEEDEEKEEEKPFYMPPTWVQKVYISPQDVERRHPGGKKTILYKNAKLEKFSQYLMPDGVVTRLIEYQDDEYEDPKKVKEWFKNRADYVELIERDLVTGTITEYFRPGRHLAVREHVYKSREPETERTMEFCDMVRFDGLMNRVETPMMMVETFKDRPDFLIYRKVIFGKRPKRVALPGAITLNNRPIVTIVERFSRNRKKLAIEDVAEQMFLISEEHIQLRYHRDDDRITAVKREFIVPPNFLEKEDLDISMKQITVTFEVDPLKKPSKNVVLYQMLVELLKTQAKSMQSVRDSEHEVRHILHERIMEDEANELTISVYDTERNEKAKKHREEEARFEADQRRRRAELELDYLAPFLARIGEPETLTKQETLKLREDCLSDMKQRLIDKANLIQGRFEKEALDLQNKQQWYQQNQISMTKEDEESYLMYCSQAMFRIHILELRLNRHKENAPLMYLALEDKLRRDVRLAKLLRNC